MKVLAFLEVQDGSLKKTGLEALTAARHIAGSGGTVAALVAGGDASMAAKAQEYGATVVHVAAPLAEHSSGAWAAITASVAADYDAVVIPASSHGKEIAPRVAVRLQAGFVADVTGIAEGGYLKPAYAGKAIATVAVKTAKHVVSVRPNIFTATPAPAASATTSTVDTASATVSSPVKNVTRSTGKLDVAEAEIIVSGGRGLKGPEHFHLVEELAQALGGAVGASRAVVDAGWRPHNEQVGQTGKTVSPNLYVACGISGAVQHLAGMSSSKVIVAINKDKDAPIFQVADYGIVGDVFEVLPKLTAAVKN